jgi:hypothetical protein
MRCLAGVPLLLLASGCVDDDGPDPMPEPDTGTVQISTYGSAADPPGGKAGVEVIAINPDGTTTSVTTAEIGYSVLTIVEGASVVALYPDQLDEQYELWAFLGVEPGDVLEFGDPFRDEIGVETADMTVTFPSVPGATGYVAMDHCRTQSAAAPATSVTIHQFEACQPAYGEVRLVAHDETTGAVLAHGSVRLSDFVPGGTVELTAWETPPEIVLDARGLPASVTRAEMLLSVTPSHGWTAGSPALAPSGGVATWTTPWVPWGSEARLTLVTDQGKTQTTLDGFDGSALSYMFMDVAELPWLTAVEVDAGASRIVVTAPEGRRTDSTWLRVSIDGPQPYRWLVVAPPVAGGFNTFELPALPPPLDGANLDGGRVTEVVATLVDYPFWDGYDEVRGAPAYASYDAVRLSEWYARPAP